MKRILKNPQLQFAVLVIIIAAYSIAIGKSLESTVEQLERVLPIVSPSPIPSVSPKIQGASDSTYSAQVVSEVIDGDTIRLATGETLRYIGIDTPETQHPQVGKECFGSEASRRNEELVLGRTVLLETDVNDTDRYGRLLRYVWLDGELVNEKLVKEGYAIAKAYPPDIKYQLVLELAEREARENNRGMWSACINSP